MSAARYILTLSCADVRGIVAAVSSFLLNTDCFIIESGQFGDPSTERFFMRVEFSTGTSTPPEPVLKEQFAGHIGNRFGMDWYLHDKAERHKLLILVSRYGHCLNDLLYRTSNGQLPVDIVAVVSNHPDFRPMVEWHQIPYYHFPAEQNKSAQENQILEVINRHSVDVVALARYMQILSPEMCSRLSGMAINIHHSFLPSFKGAKPYTQAYDKGVKLIGATAHYVTTDLDEGPIIEQEVARVDHTHTPDDLAAIGRDTECNVLFRALKYHIEQRVILNEHKTVVFK